MLYDMINATGLFGTFETDENIYDVLDVLKACYGELVVVEHRDTSFKNRYYVHRYVDGQWNNVICLGSFDTNMTIHDCWDMLFQIFNENSPDGIFVRKEKIC